MAQFDVFISFKKRGARGELTPEYAIAEEIVTHLEAIGLRVFWSEEAPVREGESEFRRSIRQALEVAPVMVVLAATREHLLSPNVHNEWESFLNLMLSRPSPKRQHFLLSCGTLNHVHLPADIAGRQLFPLSDLDKLLESVVTAAERPQFVEDHIRASLHCVDASANSDKVYFITVHTNGGGEKVVTAHWGPRQSKRLNQQTKLTTHDDEHAIEDTIHSLVRAKLRDGYRKASTKQILTIEARTLMASYLGVSAVVPKGRRV